MNKLEKRQVSNPKICIGTYCFPEETIINATISAHNEERYSFNTADVQISPGPDSRWDYRAEATLDEDGERLMTGICTNAIVTDGGDLSVSLSGPFWKLQHSHSGELEFFGMPPKEIMYWLMTLLKDRIEIEGLKLDNEPRPFMYAVPLNGITDHNLKSFFQNDIGVAAAEMDTTFAPLMAKLKMGQTQPVWQPDVPKAYGVVFASDLLQAEQLALDRAQFTADLINFTFKSGASHFETRNGGELLSWNAGKALATVSLHPWILLREIKSLKGWVRCLSPVETRASIELSEGFGRIKSFFEHFKETMLVDDFHDQIGKRELSRTERRILRAVRRCIRWHGIASREPDLRDKFLGFWIALEAILESIEYPEVFAGDRVFVKDYLSDKIDSAPFPKNQPKTLTVDANLLKGRLLQNEWPLKSKLGAFAEAFGIKLQSDDLKLINDLRKIRGRVLHSGRQDSDITVRQVRGLEYLVERLLMASSIGAYRNVEDSVRHKLAFGEVDSAIGGGAPLQLDGVPVAYKFEVRTRSDGTQETRITVDGKIYDFDNSDIELAK
jgi:hypothetical protein